MIRKVLPALVIGLFVLIRPESADSRVLTTEVSVSAGKWSLIRLLNTPEKARIDIDITSDGNISVFLLGHDANGKPLPTNQALHRVRGSGALKFSAIANKAGTYFLVLDNRQGSDPRSLNVSADITAGKSAKSGTLAQAIASLKAKLRQAFIFNELQIDVAACGKVNSFSGPKRVLICAEHIEMIKQKLKSKEKIRDALLFVILHEIGHVLLRQWDYPFYANEEVADEIATVLMVLFNEQRAVRTQADFFASHSADAEAAIKKTRDDRHPLSVQRARNILRWLGDTELVAKWQKILVPHMQTRSTSRCR